VIDFGAGNVLDVNPITGAASVFMPRPPATGSTRSRSIAGNVYVSSVHRTCLSHRTRGRRRSWARIRRHLRRRPWPNGFPPGANGLQFNSNESALFVANTANDTIVRIANNGGVAGTPAVFTNSINGADGLFLDEHDNIWVCANQSDEIVVVDKTGKAISKLGDFDGLKDGKPVGLLFPASLVRSGDWIFITNLSLDLRPITGQQSIVSQYAADVKRHTIARIRARVLGFKHGDDD
jgi:hypothetical protein